MSVVEKLECFGTANTSDCCMQCPDNEECVKETMKRHNQNPMEKLEEAIKNKAFLNLQTFMIEGGEIIPHQKMVFLSDVLKFVVAFKKDYDSKIHVPRKLLEDILYNLKQEPEAYCDEIRVVEELLGEKTK